MAQYLLFIWAYAVMRKIYHFYVKNISNNSSLPKASKLDKMGYIILSAFVSPIFTPFWILRDITGIKPCLTKLDTPLDLILY